MGGAPPEGGGVGVDVSVAVRAGASWVGVGVGGEGVGVKADAGGVSVAAPEHAGKSRMSMASMSTTLGQFLPIMLSFLFAVL